MKAKDILKSVIGAERLSNIKGIVCHYKCSANLAISRKSKFDYDASALNVAAEFSDPDYHVFRGYYDFNYLRGNIFLCHRLSLCARNHQNTRCEIGYYEMNDPKRFYKISESSAWCWQQGCRLRWHPQKQDWILFNDVDDMGYCTRIMDIRNKETIQTISWPIYDLSSDFHWGISLNFSRLQRLRPGYGYNYFPDSSINEKAPDNDGIFMVDIKKNNAKLIVSLKSLAEKVDTAHNYTHYLNHVSISPDNGYFIFFHIYTDAQKRGWKTILYVYDVALEKITALEKRDRVSHYCWIDNHSLMVTCHRDDGREYYCTYNVLSGEKEVLHVKGLNVDGHPNLLANDGKYITDTYPLANSIQSIRVFSLKSDAVKTIAQVYHDFRLRGEKRCDLHPSIENHGKAIAIDTTYHGKRRSIVVFDSLMEEK